MNTLGKSKLHITLGDHSRTLHIPVVENLVEECIIGQDILREFSVHKYNVIK